MSTPFIAELRIISFNFAPKGWAMANGQRLPINQNQALFSLLGTTYGGDGRVNFALPNLQGRAALHFGGTVPTLGSVGGEVSHSLSPSEMPAHTHTLSVGTGTAKQQSPAGATFARTVTGFDVYGATPDVAMSGSSTTVAGGSQPHENQPPYLVMNVIIALFGIFPSRN